MKPLSVGYQIVAGLAIVYALLTGGCMVSIYGSSPGSHVKFEEWLLVGLWACKSLTLLLAGCLLAYAIITDSTARRANVIRAAQLAFLAAALGSLLQAIALVRVTREAFGPHGGEQGPLAIFFTGPMFLMAVLWLVIALITALSLDRQRRRAQRVDQERLNPGG